MFFLKQNMYHSGNNKHTYTAIYTIFNFTFLFSFWPFSRGNVCVQWDKDKTIERTFSHFLNNWEHNVFCGSHFFLNLRPALKWAILPTNITKLTVSSVSWTSWFLDMECRKEGREEGRKRFDLIFLDLSKLSYLS